MRVDAALAPAAAAPPHSSALSTRRAAYSQQPLLVLNALQSCTDAAGPSLPLQLSPVRPLHAQRRRHAGRRHRQPRRQERPLGARPFPEVQSERGGATGPVGLGPNRLGGPAVALLPAGRGTGGGWRARAVGGRLSTLPVAGQSTCRASTWTRVGGEGPARGEQHPHRQASLPPLCCPSPHHCAAASVSCQRKS